VCYDGTVSLIGLLEFRKHKQKTVYVAILDTEITMSLDDKTSENQPKTCVEFYSETQESP